MRGIDALIRGISDPRAGLNILWELVFNGQAGLVEAPLTNIEVTPPSFISAVFNWILFGPLLYFVVAPAYYLYCIPFAIVTDVIEFGASIKYAFLQTFRLVRSIFQIFFLTAFALQVIRVFLLTLNVPGEALSIQYLESFLNLFFSIFTIFGESPRWVQQPPGRHNPTWLMIALIAICIIANEIKNLSAAWVVIVAHFVAFVTFAGPITRRPSRANLIEPKVYRKQAFLALLSLNISFLFTETPGWARIYKYISMVILAAVSFILLKNSQVAVTMDTIYEWGPKKLWQVVAGSIFVAIFLSLVLRDSIWYHKWPLIVLFSFVAFFFHGVYEVMTKHLYEEANSPPESPRPNNDDDLRAAQLRSPSPSHNSDSEPDEPEVLGDKLNDVDERLPAALANIGPFPTNDELAVLFWYRNRLQARLRRMELPPHQQGYIARRVYEIIPIRDIVKSSYDNAVLEHYINRAQQYEMANNPDFY
ncbi:hypothetical protein F4679DRAFT_593858 [Xylaria curta]|nr:hypothetical protein F4679DRAFT_593858 [Xylaria curta]